MVFRCILLKHTINSSSPSLGDGYVALFVRMFGLDNDPLDRELAVVALWKYSLGEKRYIGAIMQFQGCLNLIVNLLKSELPSKKVFRRDMYSHSYHDRHDFGTCSRYYRGHRANSIRAGEKDRELVAEVEVRTSTKGQAYGDARNRSRSRSWKVRDP